jgi:hypothetical protein
MSKLLYIHKPSLTAVVEYKPDPTLSHHVTRVATVSIVGVVYKVMMIDFYKTSTEFPVDEAEKQIMELIRLHIEEHHLTFTEYRSDEVVQHFMNTHPQHLVESEAS